MLVREVALGTEGAVQGRALFPGTVKEEEGEDSGLLLLLRRPLWITRSRRALILLLVVFEWKTIYIEIEI